MRTQAWINYRVAQPHICPCCCTHVIVSLYLNIKIKTDKKEHIFTCLIPFLSCSMAAAASSYSLFKLLYTFFLQLYRSESFFIPTWQTKCDFPLFAVYTLAWTCICRVLAAPVSNYICRFFHLFFLFLYLKYL